MKTREVLKASIVPDGHHLPVGFANGADLLVVQVVNPHPDANAIGHRSIPSRGLRRCHGPEMALEKSWTTTG
jgi:hypothetical protein